MKIFKWFRDCFLGIRYGLVARTLNMSINESRPHSTVTVFDDGMCNSKHLLFLYRSVFMIKYKVAYGGIPCNFFVQYFYFFLWFCA